MNQAEQAMTVSEMKHWRVIIVGDMLSRLGIDLTSLTTMDLA